MTNEEAVWTLQEAVDEAFGAGIEIITRDGCEAIEMAIEALKERKTGEWIVTNHKDELYGFLCACSICGNTMIGAYNYCPDCGAKMEVDE